MQVYYTYVYFWFFFTAIPVVVNIVFGILAYRNLQLMNNANQLHGADRQITFMVLAQVVLIIFGVLPYSLYQMYALATASFQKDQEQKDKDALAAAILGYVATFEFGVSRLFFVLLSNICFFFFCI
jgi:hypothetical protein